MLHVLWTMDMISIKTFLMLNLLIFLDQVLGVPPENCLVNQQCTPYCQSYGYSYGICRTRLSIKRPLPLLKRFCHCTQCDPKYCQNYCTSIGRKYTSCTCYNFSFDHRYQNYFQQHNEYSVANDCNDNVLYCQCGL